MSDCGVCIGSDDQDSASLCIVFWPKARKSHQCVECNRVIEIGQAYECVKMLFDGDWGRYKTCQVCAEIRTAFSCGAMVFGELWVDMKTYAFPKLNESCFNELHTVEAKKYLRERWMKWKGLVV